MADVDDALATLAPISSDLFAANPELQDRLVNIADLALAGLEDVLNFGTPQEKMAIVAKLGPMMFKRKDDDAEVIDIDAAKAELRSWIEQAGRSWFND